MPMGFQGYLAHRQVQVVQHAQLRDSGQSGAPSGPTQGLRMTARAGVRAAYGAALEQPCGGNATASSNLAPSAIGYPDLNAASAGGRLFRIAAYARRAGGSKRIARGATATSRGRAVRQAPKASSSIQPHRSRYPSRNVVGSRPAVRTVSGTKAERGTPGKPG